MDELLKLIQSDMMKILMVFDNICRENNIQYSLHGGTLLGAVRHKGFIPWDDDLDIIMTRENYDAFICAWIRNRPDGYFLQTKEVEENYTRAFAKIRKEHTLFLQEGEDPETIHTGVFIDIFPVDRIPNRGIGFYPFLWDCLRYQLYTREFIPPKVNIITKVITFVLLNTKTHTQVMKKRAQLYKKITRFNNNNSLRLAVLESPRHISHPFPPDFFDSYIGIPFEGKEFMCISKWDELLTIWYGDYMKMPPQEERVWKHHPKMVDMNSSYEEIKKERK
ncbi:MAG: LicD family protein [Lachnospiraceae bacterium]|jgi:lipopolysaccharide cholinephosphotransferase|nr:LicD family protein [Lachnospiraceae bacterium]